MIPHRYFASSEQTYEAIRSMLDNAWGLPNDKGTVTCIQPAHKAPRRTDGYIVLGVASEWCAWEPAATMLPQLLASNAVEEITAEEYQAALAPQEP